MSAYRIRPVDATDSDVNDEVLEMHLACDFCDPPDFADCHLWFVYLGDVPVGFVSMTDSPHHKGFMYLNRIGVMRKHRGSRLALRLIRTCERWCRKHGKKGIVSDSSNNPPSATTFMRAGYKNFDPRFRWPTDRDSIYWRKRLDG